MAGPVSGFNADAVRAGLRTAMQFGLPTVSNDQPTFFFAGTSTSIDPTDDEGVPYDPTVLPTVTTPTKKKVQCAVEFVDGEGKVEAFGIVNPSRVKLTFLDQDWAVARGFLYVVIQGQRYFYLRTEPPVALGTVDVYTVHCRADDEG